MWLNECNALTVQVSLLWKPEMIMIILTLRELVFTCRNVMLDPLPSEDDCSLLHWQTDGLVVGVLAYYSEGLIFVS
jgi:hypothetical protein